MNPLRRGWLARTLCGAGLFGALGGIPAAYAADYQGEKVAEFVREMTEDYGFASEQVVELLAQAERKQAILDAISRPAERVKPWKEYRPIFITDSRVAQGVDFWRQNEAALTRAQQAFGVPAEVIVAIIGVETFYGRNTGNYRVIDALSTLGFDYPPRQPFFRQQLKEFLLLAREEQVDPLALSGSYAGAMGLPQFMPSSFRAYAVDFDEDGRIDIWKNPVDAIGSAANYFKQHGWTAGAPVVARAEVKGERYSEGLTEGLEPVKSAAELRELGWQWATPTEMPDDTAVTAFRLDGADGDEYWVGLPNFYVITRYNRSVMYAMAVNELAEQLAQARGAQ
ncbi:lytic murein transglycosylase B [Stutzerimonas stutzeri]|uniref:lytic murein transglycosylase B n=1 Tax=Stutzerimonas stutzeri TaxID=316 RepID=UPI003C6F634F|nr:lytic murein transglycosylase B [Stutzerimonas stutzeri]